MNMETLNKPLNKPLRADLPVADIDEHWHEFITDLAAKASEDGGDRKQERSKRREQEILRAALRVFARDGISRSRGLCPNPIVNPNFQVASPNSKARYKTARDLLESLLWVADMLKLLVKATGRTWGSTQRPIYYIASSLGEPTPLRGSHVPCGCRSRGDAGTRRFAQNASGRS